METRTSEEIEAALKREEERNDCRDIEPHETPEQVTERVMAEEERNAYQYGC